MRLIDINSETIKKVNNKEIISLHRRIHQLYILAIKRKPTKKEFILFLEKTHEILLKEMNKRQIIHNSPLTVVASLKFLRK